MNVDKRSASLVLLLALFTVCQSSRPPGLENADKRERNIAEQRHRRSLGLGGESHSLCDDLCHSTTNVDCLDRCKDQIHRLIGSPKGWSNSGASARARNHDCVAYFCAGENDDVDRDTCSSACQQLAGENEPQLRKRWLDPLNYGVGKKSVSHHLLQCVNSRCSGGSFGLCLDECMRGFVKRSGGNKRVMPSCALKCIHNDTEDSFGECINACM